MSTLCGLRPFTGTASSHCRVNGVGFGPHEQRNQRSRRRTTARLTCNVAVLWRPLQIQISIRSKGGIGHALLHGLAIERDRRRHDCQRRRQTSPHGGARVGQVSASFYPRIASLFGLREPLLRPDLRSPQPSRAAAVKEARRAPRSGAQRPGRPRARRHPHRSRTTRQLSRQTIVTSRPPATGNAVVRRLGADLAAIAVRF